MLDGITLKACVWPIAYGATCWAWRACLTISLHVVSRLALRTGPRNRVAAVAQISTASSTDAVLQRPAVFTLSACLGVRAFEAAICLALNARGVVFLEEPCGALIASGRAWDGAVRTVGNLTSAVNALIFGEIIPELRGALFTRLEVTCAVNTALHTASLVKDAALRPALINIIFLALVTAEDAAHRTVFAASNLAYCVLTLGRSRVELEPIRAGRADT